MKNFVYLVQGESDLIKNYFHLTGRDNADAIFLTYDKEIDNAIYFPNSTWSEGRNRLLAAAKENGEYLYYIFCDDDIEIKKGSWDEFERLLILHNPAIGFPVEPTNRKNRISFISFQLYSNPDQQMISFHRDLVIDGLILPYQEQLDQICWWGSGGVVQKLIYYFYRSDSIQFNNIQILNKRHARYDMTNIYEKLKKCMEWFEQERVGSKSTASTVRKHILIIKLTILFRTMFYVFKKKLIRPNYRINNNKVLKFFKDESVFLKQYNDLNISKNS